MSWGGFAASPTLRVIGSGAAKLTPTTGGSGSRD